MPFRPLLFFLLAAAVTAVSPASALDRTLVGHDVTTSSAAARAAYQAGLAAYYLQRYDEASSLFRQAIAHDAALAMAYRGNSRALYRLKQLPEARQAAASAVDALGLVDEREARLVREWQKLLSLPEGEEGTAELEKLQQAADTTIALFPEDPEVWLQRAELAASPLQGAPYVLAALRLDPRHPARLTFSVTPPPLPQIAPEPSQPIGPLSTPPKLFPGLGELSYPIRTRSSETQALFEQGLRCLHSYVTQPRGLSGAVESFQQAALLDPEAAMPYWGLSFCDPRGYKTEEAAHRALELASRHDNSREYMMCLARVLEMRWRRLQNESGKAKDEPKKALEREAAEARRQFFEVLDGAIVTYPDDAELWIWRGKAERGFYGAAGSQVASIPFELAAGLIDPDHPGSNHELVHLYEAIDRPALGWPYTIGYRESAPNMPHANHMQAHLATRLGRWQEAIDATRASRKKSLEGYPELDPTHHIDILIRALAHEGRFAEAESEPKAYRDGLPWARLLQLKLDTAALRDWVERRAKVKSPDADYMAAIVALDAGDLAAVQPLTAKVEEQSKKNSANFYRHAEVTGRYLVQSGKPDEGLKLLKEAAAKVVKDAGAHAWGGGSYMLEVWGEAALRAGRLDEAEEAFHEALAHEHGSVLGALGMQVVWERRSNAEMSAHYAERARRAWAGADAGALERQLARVRALGRSDDRQVRRGGEADKLLP